MKLNWNFQRGGGGLRTIPFHGGGMEIFWNYTMLKKMIVEAWHSIRELNALSKHIYIPDIYKVLGYPK